MPNNVNETVDYKKWGPSQPKAVFLLVHGLGAHAVRWEAAGDFFANKGIRSYAVELKNLNQPENVLHRSENFRSYYSKIIALHDLIVKENPSKKIFLVGESLGGLVSFFLTAASPGLFAGLICISPAFVNRYKLPFPDTIRVLAGLLYDPYGQFKLPFDPSMCTHDADYREEIEQDRLEYRSISLRLIPDILLSQARAKSLKNKITEPVLFLLAGEDKLVDPQVSRSIFNSLKVKDKTLIEFPGMYHSLSIETGRETVFEEILKWAENRI